MTEMRFSFFFLLPSLMYAYISLLNVSQCATPLTPTNAPIGDNIGYAAVTVQNFVLDVL